MHCPLEHYNGTTTKCCFEMTLETNSVSLVIEPKVNFLKVSSLPPLNIEDGSI